jgi:hypothetical protein
VVSGAQSSLLVRGGLDRASYRGELAATRVAGGERLTDLSPRATQLGHLYLDAGLDLLEPPPLRGTLRIAKVVRGQRVNYLLDGQAELLELPGHSDPLQVTAVESPVSTLRARRRAQDTTALVEPDSVHRDPGSVGERPNPHAPVAHLVPLLI